MAIKSRNISADGKREMTINEFKRWMKKFDADKDGKISRKELAEAVHISGGWFAKLKAKRKITNVDSNGNGYVDENGKRETTMDEFMRWMKKFDADKDGRISRQELAEAVRVSGGWFARLKARRGVRSVDRNGNGCIDDSEIKSLVEFAEKHLGVRIFHL
ncbi:hypothetical protein Dsin_003305 [Dipteronia sinensis]|uniref:EF-hand domain-containing protein n=1 Tax=Dipteronia sinensis TaxID=43782 RepID=A0AAE0B986_9ROSI|nr:hypothetical protein Dsin_003305 [Dipteronia sinensis]